MKSTGAHGPLFTPENEKSAFKVENRPENHIPLVYLSMTTTLQRRLLDGVRI